MTKHGRIERLTETSTIMVDQQSVAEKAAIQHNSMVELGEDSAFLFLLAVQDEESNKTQRELPSPDEVSQLVGSLCRSIDGNGTNDTG